MNVVYLTRTSLLEPLGQSQVLAYLRFLAKDNNITLITYEQPINWSLDLEAQEIKKICIEHNITWIPIIKSNSPRVISSLLSIFKMFIISYKLKRHTGIDVIHARSYIPAIAAEFLRVLNGTPYIFDMRALWPEELITSGRLKRDTIMHKFLTYFEKKCIVNSKKTIVLTNAAKQYLHDAYSIEKNKMQVIPTCVDIDRFDDQLSLKRSSNKVTHCCIGSLLTGWFNIERLGQWIYFSSKRYDDYSFEIITKDDPARVRQLLKLDDQTNSLVSIRSSKPHDIPAILKKHNASIMFYAGGEVSELGRSPTRMAEILASGIPVIANSGVGDVAYIIQKYRVGVLLDSNTDEQVIYAIDSLDELVRDEGLASRCKQVAEKIYSLKAGVLKIQDIYES